MLSISKKYSLLTLSNREEISRQLCMGFSLRQIARCIGKNVSTISRDIRKGSCNRCTYRAVRAHRRSLRNRIRRKWGKRILTQNEQLKNYVMAKLRKQWSPCQIAKRLVLDYPYDMTMRISKEAIYAYIYVLPKGKLKEELIRDLRRRHKRKHKQKKEGFAEATHGQIKDMTLIDDRPEEVEQRAKVGDWEGDLIIGKNRQSQLGTLVERKLRFTLLAPLKSKKAPEVRKAFSKAFSRLPKAITRSLTCDQGREMAEHKQFTKQTKIQVYFAHPGSPWERGTNENTNGLIRQYFPKGTDFNKVTESDIRKVQDLLNGRPRKTLYWKTPSEVLHEQLVKTLH